MRIELGRRKEIIYTFGEDTEAWRAEQVRGDQLKEDLETQIWLSIGFGGLGEKLGNRGGDRKWHDSFKELRRSGIDRQRPKIIEEGGGPIGDFGRRK